MITNYPSSTSNRGWMLVPIFFGVSTISLIHIVNVTAPIARVVEGGAIGLNTFVVRKAATVPGVADARSGVNGRAMTTNVGSRSR